MKFYFQIFPLGMAINHDSGSFSHPDEFDPGRFLDPETGRVNRRSEDFLFFGVGRRRCPGLSVAMMETIKR